MECRHCASALDRPGDYCLVCREANADAVVLELGHERATVTALYEEEVVGERTITMSRDAEPPGEAAVLERRNFASLIADELRRKRPAEVFVTGERKLIDALREQVHYSFYRVGSDDPVAEVIDKRGEPALEVVEAGLAEKLGGSHSTVVGGRAGQTALETVAAHPHVKKVVPGPIDAGGSGSQSGVRAKATRADEHGNVRLLVRDGSTVQENRIVTTASERELGERVREALNEALRETELQD
jgi:hypothetical protein